MSGSEIVVPPPIAVIVVEPALTAVTVPSASVPVAVAIVMSALAHVTPVAFIAAIVTE